MAGKYTDDQKFRVLAKLSADADPKDIAQDEKVPYQTVMNWRREQYSENETKSIQELINVDAVLVHRIAEEVKEEMRAAPIEQQEDIAKAVDGVVEKIDSYQQLNTKLHDTAVKLVNKIAGMADDDDGVPLGPVGLQILVESLARIQIAFFNKNSTNINVLNQTVTSDKQVSSFKAFQRP